MKYTTPDKIYKNLFVDLHLSGIWKDGKPITDAIALQPAEDILSTYELEKGLPDFDLKSFFEKHFKLQAPIESNFKTDKNKTAEAHIKTLWDELSRPGEKAIEGSCLIPLPHPYVVPGGRFNEVYYWDSFFTMLGLKIHGKWEIIEGMIQNFAWFINEIGFIPNGNRTYFLSRSQPPFFAMMVSLLAKEKGDDIYVKYLPALLQEYAYWMNGEDKVSEANPVVEHVVKMKEGLLNRYYDNSNSPRQEMYKDDFDLLEKSEREGQKLFLDIRAACESGWDFSSRWFDDEQSLETINTSEILPVDLNCLLYLLEITIAKASKIAKEEQQAVAFSQKAINRKTLIQKTFWNEATGFYHDWQYVRSAHTPSISAAATYPLCFGLATSEQAKQVVKNLTKHLLCDGGIRCTPNQSGQQWDAPNGWAPLQWMTVAGLDQYGFKKEALDIATRWVNLNEKVFQNTGKFMEKYNVEDLSLSAGGGEYENQDGFGWSNGVYLALKEYIRQNEVMAVGP